MRLSRRNPLLRVAAMMLLTVGLLLSPAANVLAAEDTVIETVPGPFDKVVTNLKRAITGQKMVIVKEVPFQQMLAMVGLKTEQIKSFEIFHPRYGKRLYQTNPSAISPENGGRSQTWPAVGTTSTWPYRRSGAASPPGRRASRFGRSGVACEEFRVKPAPGEKPFQVLDAGALVARRVRGIEPDQSLCDIQRIRRCGRRVRHEYRPTIADAR